MWFWWTCFISPIARDRISVFDTHSVCARTQATHTTKGRSVQSIALWGNRSELLPPFSLSFFFLSWHHFLLFVCLFWNAWCKSYPREVEGVLTAISLRRAWRERWRDDWEGSWSPLLSFSSHSPALASLIWSLCCCYDWRERKGGMDRLLFSLLFPKREIWSEVRETTQAWEKGGCGYPLLCNTYVVSI